MIIVITNRNLPSIPQTQSVDINVNNLGVDLGAKVDNKNRIYTAEFPLGADSKPQYKKLRFQPKGSEAKIFKNIAAAELAKPWVFFVHGFHQDPAENMAKAIDLQNNHKVNVIAFAWPSRPVDETMGWDDAWNSVVKSALSGGGLNSIFTNLILAKVKSEIKDKWNNYPPAIANAEKSNVDLIAAFNLIKEQLNSNKPPVLLIHSMGNYVLENTVKIVAKLPMEFSNIILHQADVSVRNYDWVEKLNQSLLSSTNARLYITSNINDYVLLSSKGRRAILKVTGELPAAAATERLGRFINNYLPGDIHYIDFSEGENIDDEHEFFKFDALMINADVHACLGRIFRAEPDMLPAINESSNAGFSKMPLTDVQLYKLKYIIHPADIADDERLEDILPVKSLDLFSDELSRVFDEEDE